MMNFRVITGIGVALAAVAAACRGREYPRVKETQTLDPDRVAAKMREASLPADRREGVAGAQITWVVAGRFRSDWLELDSFSWSRDVAPWPKGPQISDQLDFFLKVKDGAGDGTWARCLLEMVRQYPPEATASAWRGGAHGADQYYCIRPQTSEPFHSSQQIVEGIGTLLGLEPHAEMPYASTPSTKGPVEF